jgi:CIC family chloride channel protein
MARETKKPALKEYGTPSNINLAEAGIIGLVAAIGAVALKVGVGFFGSVRMNYTDNGSPWLVPLIGFIGGAVAGAIVQFIAPSATGSGIPQVKAAIGDVPQDLTLKTAAAKLISCVVALGSGFSMGREGPTVQMAAALSSNAMRMINSSPQHRKQLLAAGAGAGLAAAFNAPLAGVLFVIEELLGHMSGFAVGTTVVACFVAAVLSRLVGVHSLDIQMDKYNSISTFNAADIPFYLLLGALAGVLGAIFNKGIIAGLTLNRDVLKWPITVSCALVGLASGLIVMNLPPMYHDFSGLREALLSGKLSLEAVLIALALQFVLSVLAYSSGAPGGLFAPSLTMGACLGLLVAFAEQHLYGSSNAVAFAIVGMGAVFCAVARVPMTAVVIIFEMTTDFNVVLPLMISSVVSYLVAEKLDPGSIYDQLLVWGGIDLEANEPQLSIMKTMSAVEVMQTEVETILHDSNLTDIRALFKTSLHHGFPVLDGDGKVVGMLTRHDLLALADDIDAATTAVDIMTVNPVMINVDQSLAEAVLALNNYKISRLPVVDGDKLVGIITRDDIVSAESKALTSKDINKNINKANNKASENTKEKK